MVTNAAQGAGTYDVLDALILDAIRRRKNPLYDSRITPESKRIANATGREEFRVIDARLQALRKAKRIRHLTKAEGNGESGWRVVDENA